MSIINNYNLELIVYLINNYRTQQQGFNQAGSVLCESLTWPHPDGFTF